MRRIRDVRMRVCEKNANNARHRAVYCSVPNGEASAFDRAAPRLILFNHAGISSLPASKDAFRVQGLL
jgi:hypothetical protein